MKVSNAVILGMAILLATSLVQAHGATGNAEDAPAPKSGWSKTNPVAAAPADKAQIVFFRPSRYTGSSVSFSIREGDKGIAKLTNGSYFIYLTEPGIKEYNISYEARDTLKMEVEAGETYYVSQGVAAGIVAARPHLTPSTEAVFQEKRLMVTRTKPTDRK